MKQKIIVKVQMRCGKCRSKAMEIAAVAEGVISVAIEGADKDKVVVIGDGVDSAALTGCLRKKVGYATLESVQEVKPQADTVKDKDKKPAPTPTPTPTPWTSCCQNAPIYIATMDDYPDQPNCSIM